MKKILALLIVLTVVGFGAFAVADSTVDVTLEIGANSSAGFCSSPSVTSYTSATPEALPDQVLAKSSSEYKAGGYVWFKSNNTAAATIKLKATTLKSGSNTIAYTLKAGASGSEVTVTTNGTTETAIKTENGTQVARGYTIPFTASATEIAVNAATAGNYTATITLIVAGV